LTVRGAAIAVATGALILATPTAAFAHAVLAGTSPAAGAVVAATPPQVTVRFDEPVAVTPTGIRVYDDQLRRIDDAHAGHVTGRGDTVGVHLLPDLGAGTYTVTYRVISDDSHPVAGRFTFSVRAPSTVRGVVAGLDGGSGAVGFALGVARFLAYAGIVVGLGGLVFFVFWPAGRDDRNARRLVFGGLTTLFVGSAAALLLEAPYVAGEGFGAMFDQRILSTILSSHFTVALVMRLIVVAAILALYRVLLRGGRFGYPCAVAGIAVALADTFADAGHSSINDNYGLALLSDGAHVLAMATWLGGLVLLVAIVLRRHPDVLPDLLPRFSTVALGCLAVIVCTGAYQAIRTVGYWPALTETAYGRLVLVKIGALVVIVGLGYAARRFVVEHYEAQDGATGPDRLAAFRRGLAVEVGMGVAVLVVTSILVATLPGKTAYTAATDRLWALDVPWSA
jgi:copper transport protein